MSYYAKILLACRLSHPEQARKYAIDIIAGSPTPYMTRQGAYE